MIFFVVMFASSEISKDKLLSISESLRRALTRESVQASSVGVAILADPSRSTVTSASEAVREAAKAFGIDKSVSFSTDERGTIISIVDSVFFDPGNTAIKPSVEVLLREVAQFCKDTDSQVVIEGHTDDRKISTPAMPSNWELSALRAAGVTRVMIGEGIAKERMQMSAFAEIKPKVSNVDAQGYAIKENQALNRRIVIHVMRAESE